MASGVSKLLNIDVVIVACNSGSVLAECVARVMETVECASLCLVDNASNDAWPQQVASRWSSDRRFKLDLVGKNIGFGAGCNHGAAFGKAPMVLFLNPDCLIERDSLACLLSVFEQDSAIGILGADVRDTLGREESAARRFDPSPLRLLVTKLKRFGFKGNAVQMPKSSESIQIVDACSGALLLMPRSLYTQMRGFDEVFFLHGEDLDLCRRVRDRGFKVAVANQVPVIHCQGSSSRVRPVFVIWHKHLGLARYLLRYHTQVLWQRVLVVSGIVAIFLLHGLPKALFEARWRSA